MLAVPAVGSAISVTSTLVPVGSTRIPVAELITGQNGRGTEGVCQDPHMSKCVHVICGVGGQGFAIAFGIVVGDEGVGRATVTGRISVGLWTTKGSDATVLEGGLEGESVLEGLGLTDPRIFARSDSSSAAVVNLWHTSVRQRDTIPEGGPYLLSDIGGCPGQATEDCPKIVNGNI